MPAPEPSPAAPSATEPLADRAGLLERAGPQRTAIYTTVRKVIDELDEVAPWDVLYAPPDDSVALVDLVRAFSERVEAVPARVERLLEGLRATGMDDESLEDIDFFFGGIHGMVASDLQRLSTKLEELETTGASTQQQRAYVCEITADVKGKYSSAVMGAASSLIAEGLWDGLEVEPVLFPEKAAEFERNEGLVESIREVQTTLERLPTELPFVGLQEAWKRRERPDRYVLADLYGLKSRLCSLLKLENRRALYSGDYHQIQRREGLLSERLNELEQLHCATWSRPVKEVPEETWERLGQLLLEVAALLDAHLLQELIGSKSLKDLRAVVVTERARGGRSEMGSSLPAGHGALVPLLAEDDLTTYMGALHGAVLKRLSLQVMEPEPPSAAVSAQPEPVEPAPVSEQGSPPEGDSDELAILPDLEEEEPPPMTEERAAHAPSSEMAVLSSARECLHLLRSTSNPSWKGFLMVERLLGKQGRIPPRMIGLALPLVEEVSTKLIPLLKEVATFTDFPVEVVEKLESRCTYLESADVNPKTLQLEIPEALRRISSLLEESAARLTELVVNRSVF